MTDIPKFFAVLCWATNVLQEMEARCCCCWLWENSVFNHAFSFAAGQLAFLIDTTVTGGGGGVPLSQRATLMKQTQINPLCTRRRVVSFIDSPKCSDIEILPPAAERIQFVFNRVQVELGGPQREFRRLFPLQPRPTLSFISIREKRADCSDAEKLGMKCWWHMSTPAGCWGDETVALQLALITHHWQ